MTVTKLLDPKNDIAFKRIFGTEKNKDILIHFLNDILSFQKRAPIVDITYLPTIQDPEIASQKTSIVDVLCEDEQDNKYIIEMQVSYHKGFEKRALYYASKAYSSQAKVGGLYENLKEVLFLAIADYVVFPKQEKFLTCYDISDTKDPSHKINGMSFIFLELPKFTKGEDELKHLENTIEKWCYFFKYAEEVDSQVLEDVLKSHTIMEKAMQELIHYNWTEEELSFYEQAEKKRDDLESCLLSQFDAGMEKGRVEGIEKGRAEGEVVGAIKAKQEMLLKLLSKGGMTDEDILQTFDMTTAELDALKQQL